MMSKHSLTIPDFARLLGHPEQKLPPACRDAIAQGNWDYVLAGVKEGRKISLGLPSSH